jgi:hypothetical protein
MPWRDLLLCCGRNFPVNISLLFYHPAMAHIKKKFELFLSNLSGLAKLVPKACPHD